MSYSICVKSSCKMCDGCMSCQDDEPYDYLDDYFDEDEEDCEEDCENEEEKEEE